MPKREEALYMNYSDRMIPRLLWPSTERGTAIAVLGRNGHTIYKPKPYVAKKSGARKLTEAEDNAIGRAIRRRQNKRTRGWLPYAMR